MKTTIRLAVALFAATMAVAQAPAPADATAMQTREEFRQILRQYPPELPAILELDPTLFSNDAFLSTYPALKSYVTAHPDVSHNPRYYLEDLTPEPKSNPDDRETATMHFWREVLGGFAALFVFGFVTCTLAWLVKTFIAQRRWSQAARTQAEVHQKMLDRFGSSQELLTYLDSPAGKRFLEAAPAALETGAGAPLSRVLWSVQAGLVLICGGAGLHIVSGRLIRDAALPLSVVGIVALSVGIGFVLSAIVSYVLSRKLQMLASSGSGASE